MKSGKPPKLNRKTEVSLVRSSAAEYLTFVAATGSNGQAVEMRYEDENIWLSQKMMATLYDVTIPAINQHLKRIFADRELAPDAVIKQLLTTAADGKTYNVKHYSLQAIIAVGFKIENERAVQFRKWATQVVKDYTIQGWVTDVDRLKSGGSVLTQEFFDRQLEKVREIRLSERKFYEGHAPHSHDDGRLGGAPSRLPPLVGPRDLAGRWQGKRRTGEATRAHRVREVPHRPGPPLRERLRSRRGRDQAPW